MFGPGLSHRRPVYDSGRPGVSTHLARVAFHAVHAESCAAAVIAGNEGTSLLQAATEASRNGMMATNRRNGVRSEGIRSGPEANVEVVHAIEPRQTNSR